MKLAIVHDWIVEMSGSERVLQAFHRLWPSAPIFTLFYRALTVHQWFPDATIIASGLQRFPSAWRYYPVLAPLMPSAIESLDLSAFDTVISSSVIFSKGIIVRPDTRHICYCYSPTRMLWDRSASYERVGALASIYRHALRTWDLAASKRPDTMVAISSTVSDRITKFYRRTSVVVPPPARKASSGIDRRVPDGEFFLIVARIRSHKSLELVIDAFTRLRYRLIIAGEGPLRSRLTDRAGSNITWTGWVSDEELNGLYERCRAVIVPNEEDWGLTAVEAMSHGKPVLALRKGGATETIVEGITGEFFDDPIPEALVDGIRRIQKSASGYNVQHIRTHGEQFGQEQFYQRMRTLVDASA